MSTAQKKRNNRKFKVKQEEKEEIKLQQIEIEDITIGNETANIMGGINNSGENLKVPDS